jgi:hypothetical protein
VSLLEGRPTSSSSTETLSTIRLPYGESGGWHEVWGLELTRCEPVTTLPSHATAADLTAPAEHGSTRL